jgi:hypothetical protein
VSWRYLWLQIVPCEHEPLLALVLQLPLLLQLALMLLPGWLAHDWPAAVLVASFRACALLASSSARVSLCHPRCQLLLPHLQVCTATGYHHLQLLAFAAAASAAFSFQPQLLLLRRRRPLLQRLLLPPARAASAASWLPHAHWLQPGMRQGPAGAG